MRPVLAGLLFAFFLPASPMRAGEADVVDVVARSEGDATWRFDVTVRHDDDGWDHYADLWEIRSLDGTVLGTRTLLHPHDMEQPFTRSLSGVTVPEGTRTVEIFARDSVHGFGDTAVKVDLLESAPE